jgi:hypothetical protein
MYKLVFWFLLFWTIVSLFLYSRGYDVLNSLMLVLVIDLISLGFIVEMGKKGPFKEINSEITSKLDNIEKVCQSILNSSGGDAIVAKIEEKINKQKDDVNYLLDRMSRKMLELEDKIGNFGVSLAENVEKLGDRMDKIQRYEPEEKNENSFPIGETVYVEDEYANVEEEQE